MTVVPSQPTTSTGDTDQLATQSEDLQQVTSSDSQYVELTEPGSHRVATSSDTENSELLDPSESGEHFGASLRGLCGFKPVEACDSVWETGGIEVGLGQSDLDHPNVARGAGRGQALHDDADCESMAGPSPQKRLKLQPGIPHDLKSSLAPLQIDGLQGVTGACNSSFDFHLQDSCLRLTRNDTPKQLWEVGFGQALFGQTTVGPVFKLPLIGRFDEFNMVPQHDTGVVQHDLTAHMPFRSRRLVATKLAKSDDHLRSAALRRLRLIVLFDPSASQLGRSLLQRAGSLVDEAEISRSFHDAFAGRATGTLTKRASDFYRFSLWQIDVNQSHPLKPTEKDLYAYLNHLRDSGKAPTSDASFLKAWAFVRHVIGLSSNNQDPLVSSRVQGVAKSMYLEKRPLHQAPPIPADMVTGLERLMFSATMPTKYKCIVWFILFCLYASSRFGDAAKATGLTLDMAGHMYLLETGTLHYKTASTSDRKTTILPLLALGTALYELPWSPQWIEARKLEKLDELDPLMPALSEVTDQWLQRPMTTGEGGYWLRDFLCMTGVTEDKAASYSCHSLKCTAISWVSKAGVMTAHERKIMGHHWDTENAMPLTYSRDALCTIMEKLYKVVVAIKDGHFNPDASRAARIAAATGGPIVLDESTAEPLDNDPVVEPPVPDSDVEQEDMEGCEKRLSGRLDGDGAQRMPFPHVDISGCVQHRVSGIVHLIASDDVVHCGRRKTSTMIKPNFDAGLAHEQTFCEQCHRALLS